MKKYKITHLVSAEFEATAIVNADEIEEKTNDLKAYKKPENLGKPRKTLEKQRNSLKNQQNN